jgi:predicted NAD/FAD-dependent oxidoreductase
VDHTAEVVVVGAGLAGLRAALELSSAGLEVAVLEAGDAAGGRVRTDRVDGMLLDRGFQLLNPAYPQAPVVFDLAALDLHSFGAGVVVAHGRRRDVLADPRRMPRYALDGVRFPLGSVREKLAFVRWAAGLGYCPASRRTRSRDAADVELAVRLRAVGLTGPLTDGVLRPFLAGVLAEDRFGTSARFAELLVRSFVRGTPALPAAGMQALPDQLAARLPAGALHLDSPVRAVRTDGVDADTGSWRARAVVVASDPCTAARLTDRPEPSMRPLTTWYHLAPRSPARAPLLHVDAERRGPLVNTGVLTDVVPSYAPGRTLVSSSALGTDVSDDAARAHLAVIYGVATAEWELVASYRIPGALPATPPGTPLRQPVELGTGLFVAGDHRDTASLQGALVSGRRAARAVLARLGVRGRRPTAG